MEFFKIRRVIPFMRHAVVFNVISLVTFLAAVGFLAGKGLNFSVEFTGGTLIEVAYKQASDVEKIRATLEKAGFKVEEVPIVFRDRQHGQSKMSWRIAAEAMWLVPLLRFR